MGATKHGTPDLAVRVFDSNALYAANADRAEMPDDWEYVMRDRGGGNTERRKEFVNFLRAMDENVLFVDKEYAWGDTLNEHFGKLRDGGQPGI